MDFTPNHIELLRDINEQISDANASIHKLQQLSGNLASDHDDDDEEHTLEEMVFRSKLERIYVSLCLLLESLGYSKTLVDFRNGFTKYKDKLTDTSILPYVGEPHSELLGYFSQYHKTLSTLLGTDFNGTEHRNQRALLQSILQNTPKIVYDRGINPSREAEVRKCVYDILIHVFPDTVKEVPIAQMTKTYKPDLGIRSLKTAVEYKYVVDEHEAKTFIGGFYEDMHGYAGSEDWNRFYAVLYMTKPFFTLQQIQAEFKIVGVAKNWIPILVHGDGSR